MNKQVVLGVQIDKCDSVCTKVDLSSTVHELTAEDLDQPHLRKVRGFNQLSKQQKSLHCVLCLRTALQIRVVDLRMFQVSFKSNS